MGSTFASIPPRRGFLFRKILGSKGNFLGKSSFSRIANRPETRMGPRFTRGLLNSLVAGSSPAWPAKYLRAGANGRSPAVAHANAVYVDERDRVWLSDWGRMRS